MKQFTIKLNFFRDILGSQPADEELKKKYIVNKMTTGRTGMSAEVALNIVKDEIATLEADEKYQQTIEDIQSKSITVFFRDKEKRICVGDMQLRGMFKNYYAFLVKEKMIKSQTKKDGSNYTTDAPYRKFIGDRISFKQLHIPFEIQPERVEIYQRPIRVDTPLGPRTSIACSEVIRAPNSITFDLFTYEQIEDETIKMILERGRMLGFGQWANAQFGCFEYEILEKKEL